jgi:hypothetical protein
MGVSVKRQGECAKMSVVTTLKGSALGRIITLPTLDLSVLGATSTYRHTLHRRHNGPDPRST